MGSNGRRTRKPPRAAERRKNKILLIHGHDAANLSRLAAFVRSLFRCPVQVLSELPALGRTIIEKFEQAAMDAGFVIALLTPDDVVQSRGKRVHQPRQNAVFELGLAYGKLGRSRVCILLKKGTQLPSDLHGINWIPFSENVLDAWPLLQVELESAGMLRKSSLSISPPAAG